MKIAILNFSGNVGKTTIAAHLLKPRMPDATIFSIESINTGIDSEGVEAETMRGKRFGELIDELMMKNSAIVDIGASNVEDFLKMMEQYDGSFEEFDVFVIPVVKERKVQMDTMSTIQALGVIGIDPNKIRIVFNKLDVDESINDSFPALVEYSGSGNKFNIENSAAIYSNEVFERLKSVGKSLGDITADTTDYRAQLKTAKDEDEKAHCIQMVALKRLAVSANKNLDTVFEAITK